MTGLPLGTVYLIRGRSFVQILITDTAMLMQKCAMKGTIAVLLFDRCVIECQGLGGIPFDADTVFSTKAKSDLRLDVAARSAQSVIFGSLLDIPSLAISKRQKLSGTVLCIAISRFSRPLVIDNDELGIGGSDRAKLEKLAIEFSISSRLAQQLQFIILL
jgi:hypothetical protein